MKNRKAKKLNFEKLKIAKLNTPHAIKGGTFFTWLCNAILVTEDPNECQANTDSDCRTDKYTCPQGCTVIGF